MLIAAEYEGAARRADVTAPTPAAEFRPEEKAFWMHGYVIAG
jgi:hypothetical protein